MHQEAITRAAIRNINISQRRNEREKPLEQFRIGAFGAGWQSWCTEIVAGRAEPGEDLKAVATRETKEETGLALTRLEPVCTYLTNPSCSTEVMHMFAAQVECSRVDGFWGLEHEDEDIRVFRVPAVEAFNWLRSNKVSNANLIIALQALALRRDDYRRRWTTNS